MNEEKKINEKIITLETVKNNEIQKLECQIQDLQTELRKQQLQAKFAWFLNCIQGTTKPLSKFIFGKSRGKVVAKYLNSSIQILSGAKLFNKFSWGYELWIIVWTLVIGFGVKMFGGLVYKRLQKNKLTKKDKTNQ